MAKNAVAVLAFFFTAIQLLLASLHIRGVRNKRLYIFFKGLTSGIFVLGVEATIGVNYGTVGNDLPPPSKVAHFLLESTFINRVRLFDANSEVLKAFAFTGIALTVTIPKEKIPSLTKLSFAQQWVKTNIVHFTPATNVVRILVGNEVISTTDRLYMGSLIPAMQNLHTALVGESLDFRIKVSTPHSLGILSTSTPPSSGKFRQGYDTHLLKPLLSFLRATGSPFLINPYPFFGSSDATLDYALFRPNSRVFDEMTKKTYTNMLDGQLDVVFSALKLLSFSDVDIVIAETGWPSKGELGAAEYNGKLMQHATSGVGTPLIPNRTFETYIFALFNEDLKPGPTCERNFGLFQPDMTPVYNIGILRRTAKSTFPTYPTPTPVSPAPKPSKGKQWCLPKSGASDEDLQMNLDYVCGLGLDCKPIQVLGACFLPDTEPMLRTP
ncbi:hypothetical protein RJ639_032689 [Escallonia herrerae]|uniref:glucan endo-1,3-beta-D-glucosidase n=1 Tax=Escallonia herrerae TaxID=1293975 RepID=A0AA88WVC8_9ASTE|nr:hypothetical protein RJ639_032689 [Escallonia herrerae]